MRKLIKKSAGWIHTSLIIALIIPTLFTMADEQVEITWQNIYFKCLVIILPVVMSDFAIEKCRRLFSYLIASILILASTGGLAWLTAGSIHQSDLLWGYMALLICETIFVILTRFMERLQKKKEADAIKGEDPEWRPSISVLREPSFLMLIYFLAIYTFAVNLNNPAVCNAALFSAVVYTLTTLLYQYINETEKYLSLNKRTCNLPSRRIYGIGTGMLAIFLLLFMIILLPSLFTISKRHYRDLRQQNVSIEMDYTELKPENPTENTMEDPLAALRAEAGEIKPLPQWLTFLFYVIEAAIFAFLALALLQKIFATFRDFRMAIDENGDVVEKLEDAEETIQSVKKAAPNNHRKLSERERIRKEYRKTIRRHRKDRPAPCETPLEIEINAGIADSEDGKELHRNYEWARYGSEIQ